MTLDEWEPTDITYSYFDSAVDVASREAELEFVVRDYCLSPIYSLPNITVVEDETVLSYAATPGQLMIVKEVL